MPEVTPGWIDTHCHLDAVEFAEDRTRVLAELRSLRLEAIVIPAVNRSNWNTVASLANGFPQGRYALGIHPLYALEATERDLLALDDAIGRAKGDDRFVAVGEIGLDYFVERLCSDEARRQQAHVFREQLKIARRHDMPVLLHVRRAQDDILKHLKDISGPVGIAHAFNGSDQQAKRFVDRGFCLGFGGAMTYDAARRIRSLAANSIASSVVLETDSPDIPPVWRHGLRNSPEELPRIGQVLAELRGVSQDEVARLSTANACRILPRLGLRGAAVTRGY